MREKIQRLVALAHEQRSVVTSGQIAECGFSPAQRRCLAADGWIRPIRHGAWAVGGRAPHPWEGAVAVGLLGGAGTALSHATAAAVHELPHLVKSSALELTAIRPRQPRLSGVQIHRVSRLDPSDLQLRHGLRITSPSRTIVDLSPRLGVPLLERVVDEGCVLGLWSVDDITTSMERMDWPRRPGSQSLRSVLEARAGEGDADSVLEYRIVRVLAPFAPFETQYQVLLNGELFVLDVAWPDVRVGVETDGRTPRARSYGKFHSGRHKDNVLLSHGWRVIHVTAAMDDATILKDVARVFRSLPRAWTTPLG